jgi:(1->4)-alpha-D-glucan 1-alpha-D-glucosylmutase
VMAKGVEDTAFYRYVRLLALNEVGGDPGRFGVSVAGFHAAARERAERFPHTLLAGTTHDTKRSADVRARIGALAGIADRWSELVTRWRELNGPLRPDGAPDRTEELLVYQTLAGAWPISADRLVGYLGKAVHEEKRHTSWVVPDERWDSAVATFCRTLFEHEPFMGELVPFAGELSELGERSSIGQLVLRLTSPGVPDIYGGDELWYLALVDPDNRRPIDWGRRADLLAHLAAGGAPDRETVKLWVLHQLLGLRTRAAGAFESGYEPLDSASGTCAFRRGDDIVVAVSLFGLVPEYDRPGGRWRNALEGIGASLGGYSPDVLERVAASSAAGSSAVSSR